MHKIKLVGILNVTPDSFSDGGMYNSVKKAVRQAGKLFAEGADIVDVGGEATNPWAEPIDSSEEWNRISTLIKELLDKYPGKISIDTRHPETAEKFLSHGGDKLNDVSGFQNKKMTQLAAAFQPLCIINHFPGKDAVEVHKQQIDDIGKVIDQLLARRKQLINAGVDGAKIVLDPGIGFGKTTRLNNELLEFGKHVDYPVMIGHSRKRFLGEKRFKIKTNLKAAKIAIESGAAYLRVHEIKPYRKLLENWSG